MAARKDHSDGADGRGPGSHVSTRVRALLATAAVAIIAFCVWSMSEYVQGRDPLAWLTGSGALTTTQGAADPGGSFDLSGGTDTTTTTTASLSHDDVVAAIGSLRFGDSDVSVPSDQVTVVLTGNGIWVEQVVLDDAPTMARLTAERAASLAVWASTTGVTVPQVTWIAEDGSGAVRMAISYVTDAAPTSGDDLSALLSAASAYALSGDAYAGLGQAPGFAQSAGELPALPDGSALSPNALPTATGEVLTTTSNSGGGVLSSPSAGDGSGAGGGSSSGSGSGSASGTTQSSPSESPSDAQVTVTVTVDGTEAGWGSSSATVTVPAGSTAYDALVATGVSVSARQTAYGLYVSGIGGLAEREHGGDSGWVYAVNGIEPTRSADAYTLSDGDSVVWSYVNVTQ